MATSKTSLADLESFVCGKIEEKWTYHWLSEYLMRRYSNTSGFSIRTIKRFCADKNIHRTSRLNEDELDEDVSQSVRMVHHTHTHAPSSVGPFVCTVYSIYVAPL